MKTASEILEARTEHINKMEEFVREGVNKFVQEITEELYLDALKTGETKCVKRVVAPQQDYGDAMGEAAAKKLRAAGYTVELPKLRDPWGRPEVYVTIEIPQATNKPHQFPSLRWKVIGLTIVGLMLLALLAILGYVNN